MLKIDDIVRITDGSYAARLDQYEYHPFIGVCTDDFKVLRVNTTNHLKSDSGVKVHNIHIQNCTTGAIYLHSEAFVRKIDFCCFCGQTMPEKL